MKLQLPAIALTGLSLLACSAPASQLAVHQSAAKRRASAGQDGAFPYTIHREQLDNGLEVLIVPMPSDGLVSYWSIVRTGSRDEVEQGVTPSMRAASDLTESAWYPSQLRALSLTMLRINLGDQRLTVPLRMAATSHEYRRMLEVSARRLRKKLGFTATADQ